MIISSVSCVTDKHAMLNWEYRVYLIVGNENKFVGGSVMRLSMSHEFPPPQPGTKSGFGGDLHLDA